jgi:hypothetical protein
MYWFYFCSLSLCSVCALFSLFYRRYTNIPTTSSVTFADTNTVVQLAADGSIVKLSDKTGEWASPSAPQALFSYKTFNDTEWVPFTYK